MTPEYYHNLDNWTLNVQFEAQDVDHGCPVLMQQYISHDGRLCQEVTFWTDTQEEVHLERRYYPNGRYHIDEQTDHALFAMVKTEEDYENYLYAKEDWPRYETIAEALTALDNQLQRVGWAATFEEKSKTPEQRGCRGCGRLALVKSVRLPDGTRQKRCVHCDTVDPYKR